MTQEDKELLLRDLCARLPYRPKLKIVYQQQGIKGTEEGNVDCYAIKQIVNDLHIGIITDIQIYLRPMSSMTEEERIDSLNYAWKDDYGRLASYNENIPKYINWLNTHHFDYNGLIDKGLAIEAPEGMYKF